MLPKGKKETKRYLPKSVTGSSSILLFTKGYIGLQGPSYHEQVQNHLMRMNLYKSTGPDKMHPSIPKGVMWLPSYFPPYSKESWLAGEVPRELQKREISLPFLEMVERKICEATGW